nr:site-2 protease family protein [Gemmatimonadota bacterium]
METLLWTLVLLGVLIFIHELGHFMAAKWAGIPVPRFSLGLGPRLIGFRIGSTDYCLSAIPFGGYVKMLGVEGDEDGNWMEGDTARIGDAAPPPRPVRPGTPAGDEREEVAGVWVARSTAEELALAPPVENPGAPQPGAGSPRAGLGFDSKPLWVRMIVILAGVTMNFLFGFLVFVWLSYQRGEPQVPTVVSRVAPELVQREPQLAGWRGRELRSVGGEAVATWDDVIGRLEGLGDAPVEVQFEDGRRETVGGGVQADDLTRGLAPGLAPVIGQVQE